MKKQILLIAAGGLLTLAACNNGGDKGAATQAQIDSMANAKAAQLKTEMDARNDSMIKATSQATADSIMKAEDAKKGAHKTVRHEGGNGATPAPTPAPAPAPTPAPNTPTGKRNVPNAPGTPQGSQGNPTGKRN